MKDCITTKKIRMCQLDDIFHIIFVKAAVTSSGDIRSVIFHVYFRLYHMSSTIEPGINVEIQKWWVYREGNEVIQ